jgi:DNA-binding SARP family transcriptional activator/predicted ATPase
MGNNQPDTAAPTLHITLFNGLTLRQEGQLLPLTHPQAQRLLAFLLLQPPAGCSRQEIVTQIWPDQEPAQARRTLSEALYRLRQAMGEGWLAAENDFLALPPSPGLQVDYWQFQAAAEGQAVAAWQAAVHLYLGDLLPEFDYEWALLAREAARERYLHFLAELAWHEEGNRNLRAATNYYQKLLQQSPLREDAARGLMRTLARAGRPADAQQVYDDLHAALSEALQIPPTATTTRLAQQIREEASLFTEVAGDELPLLGRRRERQQLLALLNEAARGEGGLAVILAEAGLGKSRLLSHLAESARWRGWHIYQHKAEAMLPPKPYEPFLTALLNGFRGARRELLAELVNSHTLNIVAQLTPALADWRRPALPEPANYSPDDLVAALITFTLELAALGPTLILLDDVQWAHPLFWQLLDRLLPQLAEQQLLVVLAGRGEALQDGAPWAQLAEWEADGAWLLPLAPLAGAEVAELATAFGRQLSVDQEQELMRLSAGNPLLALNWLSQPAGSDLPQNSDLEHLLLARLAPLSPPARLALQAASVLGYRFAFDQWQQLFRTFPVSELPHLLVELEAPRLIHAEAESYRFDHDTLRSTIYRQIPPERRRQLHRQLLSILPEGTAPAALFVYHAQQSGDEALLAHHAARAGQEAAHQYQYREAVRLLNIALAGTAGAKATELFELLKSRAQANGILGEREAQRADLETMAELAAQLAQQISAQRELAILYGATGAMEEAEVTARAGLALAREHQQAAATAQLAADLASTLRIRGAYAEADALLQEARDFYEATDDRLGYAWTMDKLGGVAWVTGRYDQAVQYHQQAATMFKEAGEQYQAAMALNNLGSACWSAGDYEAARAALSEALAINRHIGHRRGEADNLDNIGGLHWIMADYPGAIDHYQQALAIRRAINDLWGISISLGNLGGTKRLCDRPEAALALLDEALAINREMSRRPGIGYNQLNRGFALLALGRLAEARDAFDEAEQIWRAPERKAQLAEIRVGWLQLAVADDNKPAVRQALAELVAILPDEESQSGLHHIAGRFSRTTPALTPDSGRPHRTLPAAARPPGPARNAAERPAQRRGFYRHRLDGRRAGRSVGREQIRPAPAGLTAPAS